MKNYSREVVNSIQKEINANDYSMISIQNPDQMPKSIYLGGAKIIISVEDDGRHIANLYTDYSFDKNDMIEWRRCSFGKFYARDWKNIDKGIESYNLYSILDVSVQNVEVRALVRLIDASEFGSEEEYNYCNNLTIEDQTYTIIKAFSPSINEMFMNKSTLEEETFQIKLISTYGMSVETDDENISKEELENIPDESSTVELF